jgi:hypothetical protein
MASVKGVNITNLDATPVVLPDASDWHGRLRVQRDTYEAAALAAGSDVTVARLPAGSRVHEIVVKHDALGAGVTLAVGDAADNDRFILAAAAAAAGTLTLSDDGVVDFLGHQYSVATDIKILTGGGAATGTIVCQVVYAND